MPVVRSYLADHAVAFRDKPAVVDDRPGAPVTVWSFAELNRQANRLAHALLGPRREARREGGLVRAELARRAARHQRPAQDRRGHGAAELPLHPRTRPPTSSATPTRRWSMPTPSRPGFSRASATPSHMSPRHRLRRAGGPRMLSGDALLARAARRRARGGASPPTHPSSMLYTSGTTGRPKGAVRMPHRSRSVVRPLLEVCGNRPDDIYITTGPLYHSGPLGYMGLGQRLGNTVILQRRFDAEDWLRLVAKYRVSMTFSAPTPIRLICALPDDVKRRYDVSSMKRMVANAAPWSMRAQGSVHARLRRGLAVGGVRVHRARRGHRARARRPPAAAGLLRPRRCPASRSASTTKRARRSPSRTCPGEVFVRSANTFTGYYKAAEATRAAPRRDFASVGDIAYRDADGFYYICDRKGDMIISGGMNIYPAEIEAALERHPDIADVAVFGIPSEEWGESVHAVVVRARGPRPRAGGGHRLCPRAPRRLQDARARSRSSPRSRAPAPARSSSACCASPSGRAGARASPERSTP